MEVLGLSIKYFLAKYKIFYSKIFKKEAKKLDLNAELEYYYKENN